MKCEPRARRYAIISGKGGVGKSVIAANLSAGLAAAGRRTLLIDADLGLANLDVILGLYPSRTLHDVLGGVCAVDKALLHAPGGFDLLPVDRNALHRSDVGSPKAEPVPIPGPVEPVSVVKAQESAKK